MKPNIVFFRCICYTSILVLSSIAFTGRSSANAQASHKIKVYVSVTCDEKHTKSLIQSWTKRELRKLLDINFVGIRDAEVVLSLQIQELTYQQTGNKTGGIAISYIFLQRVPGSPHFYFPESGLATGNKDEHLEGFCKKIVAEFDVEILEPFRIVSELAEESVKKYFQK